MSRSNHESALGSKILIDMDAQFVDLFGPHIDSAALAKLAQNPHIKELRLSSCLQISDSDLLPLLERGALQGLSICNCPQLTNQTLIYIARYLKNLAAFDCSDQTQFSDPFLILLLDSCTRLTSLSINHCELLSDAPLSHIGTNIRNLRLSGPSRFTPQSLAHLPFHLESLNLSSSNQLNNPVCQTITAQCTRLQYLDVSFCPNLTEPIASDCPLTGLKVLNLQGCPVADIGVQQTIEHCPTLTHLYLAYSPLTDKGLKVLAQKAKNLKVLDLSRCSSITDYGVNHILNSCKKLNKINLLNCPQIKQTFSQ